MSTAREELYRLIKKLNEKDVESFLHLLKRVIGNNYEYDLDDEELTDKDIAAIEKGKEQIAKGEYVDLEELKKEYGL